MFQINNVFSFKLFYSKRENISTKKERSTVLHVSCIRLRPHPPRHSCGPPRHLCFFSRLSNYSPAFVFFPSDSGTEEGRRQSMMHEGSRGRFSSLVPLPWARKKGAAIIHR